MVMRFTVTKKNTDVSLALCLLVSNSVSFLPRYSIFLNAPKVQKLSFYLIEIKHKA